MLNLHSWTSRYLFTRPAEHRQPALEIWPEEYAGEKMVTIEPATCGCGRKIDIPEALVMRCSSQRDFRYRCFCGMHITFPVELGGRIH